MMDTGSNMGMTERVERFEPGEKTGRTYQVI